MAYDGTLRFDTKIETDGFEKGTSKMGDIAKGMVAFRIIEEGFKAIAASVDKAVSRYDTLNRFPRVLEQMGYTSTEAAAATQKLSDGVQGLPTALDDVVSTAQRLTVLTGNLEESTETTLALNNAFLSSGSSAQDASRGLNQYVQMLSSGKVDMMSWRTLQETMGYALQQTAEGFGFAGESAQNDLYAALRDGDITFKQFNAKIVELNNAVGGFADTAKTATGGIGTAWTNLRTRIATGTAAIIEAIDRGLSQTRFKSIEGIIDELGKTFRDVLKGVASAFEFVAANINIIIPLLVGVGVAIAGWKIGSILTGIITAFQAASLQVSLYAGSLGVATISEAGHLAALSAKEILVGVLNGKITIAAALQHAWNAAMAANPIGVIVVAVTALIGVLVGLSYALDNATEDQRALNKAIEENSQANDDLISSIDSSRKAYEDKTRTTKAEAAVVKQLYGEVSTLASVENKSTTEKQKLSAAVNQLNRLMPELNLNYDEQNDILSETPERIDDIINATLARIELQADEERLLELMKERKATEEQIAQTTDLMSEKMEHMGIQVLPIATLQLIGMNNELTALNEKNGELAVSEENLTQIIADGYAARSEASNEFTAEQVANMEQMGMSAEEYKEHLKVVEEAEKEHLKQAEKSYNQYKDVATNAFDEIEVESGLSVEKMIENLENNQRKVKEWADNLDILARRGLDEGLLKQLREAGPKTAETVKNIVDSGDEEFAKLNDVFANGTDDAIKEYQRLLGLPETTGAPSEMLDEAATQMDNNPALTNSATEAVKSAKSAMDAQVRTSNFSSVGVNIADGIKKGIERGSSAVARAARQLVKDALRAANSQAGAKSPARAFMPLGENIDAGLAVGMKSARHTKSAASSLIDDARAAVASNQRQGITNVFNAPQSLTQAGSSTVTNTWNITTPQALGLRELRQMEILNEQRRRLGGVYG